MGHMPLMPSDKVLLLPPTCLRQIQVHRDIMLRAGQTHHECFFLAGTTPKSAVIVQLATMHLLRVSSELITMHGILARRTQDVLHSTTIGHHVRLLDATIDVDDVSFASATT